MTLPLLLLVSVAVPLLATQVLVPLVGWGARRLELMDQPDGDRRVHRIAVPRVGGVAVMGATALAMLVLGSSLSNQPGIDGIMAGAAIMTLIGLIDDVRGVSPKVKVAGQVLATLVAWYMDPQLTRIALGYGTEIEIGILGLPILMGWVVIVSNGYNLIDGINGLAASIGMVGAVAAAVIALLLGNSAEAIVSLTLAAALLGFLRFNFPRAKIFLGDSGSLAIGFMLALLTLRGATRENGAVLVVVPFLALLVPIFETALTVLRRWLRSVPVVTADANHIHHRLLEMGLAHRDATLILACAAIPFAALGVALGTVGPTLAWVISVVVIGALGFALLLAVSVLSYHELSIAGSVLATGPSRARRVIRDQIAATDLIHRMEDVHTVPELRALLEAEAHRFGFARLTILTSVEERPSADPPGRVWRVDCPLETPSNIPAYMGFSLCVLCPAGSGGRPFGTERVLHIIAPAVEAWLAEHEAALRAPTLVPRTDDIALGGVA